MTGCECRCADRQIATTAVPTSNAVAVGPVASPSHPTDCKECGADARYARTRSAVIGGFVINAMTGDIVEGQDDGRIESTRSWQAVGTSSVLTRVYDGPEMRALLSHLLGPVSVTSVDAAVPNASQSLPYTLLPNCTWLRAKSANEVTVAHVDFYYFYHNTKVLSAFGGSASSVAAAVPAGTVGACSVCSVPLSNGTLALRGLQCRVCHLRFHRACAGAHAPAASAVETAPGEWHCAACINRPVDFYTCWMPLGDLAPSDGRLALVPGSHRSMASYDAERVARLLPGGFTRAAAADAQWQAPAHIDMGDVIIFNWKTVHAATRHTGSCFRLSIDTRIAAHSHSRIGNR